MVVAEGIEGGKLELVQFDEPLDLPHFPVVVAVQVTAKDLQELCRVRDRKCEGNVLELHFDTPLSSLGS